MELVLATEADEWLTVAMETDPVVMAELGGPFSESLARANHRRRVRSVGENGTWWFTIRLGADAPPLGAIGIWASEWDSLPISETGWMLLAEHHGKG